MITAIYNRISIIIKVSIVCAVFFAASIVAMFYYYASELPDYRQLENYDPPLVTRIYAHNGKLIQEYADEKRIYIEYKEIPPLVIKAFLAAEDKNFFEHQGIDYYGIIRAAVKNIVSVGQNKNLSGGSTITQQVVKNFLLTNEQSVARKIKEAILAYRISNVYSKERILELYLNQIFFGYGSYGIYSAALNYFNKDLNDLTISEAAMLAAMPKAPSYVNPTRNKDRAKARRDWVIQRMLEEDFITQSEAEESKKHEIKIVPRRESEFASGADFYAETIRMKLVEQFGEKSVYTQGYSVATYMDEGMQRSATNNLRKALLKYDRLHGYRGPIAKINTETLLEDFGNFKAPEYTDKYDVAVVISVSADKVKIRLKNGKDGIIPIENLKWARKPRAEQLLGPQIQSASEVLSKGDVIFVKLQNDNNYTLEQIPEVEGAVLVMEVGTGRVLALTGGYSFYKSKFNRAIQADRQPGSAFKPIVYLTALENGYDENDTVTDSPISVSQGAGMPNWAPKNYGNTYLGDITFRKALEKSRNIPTVRIALDIGIDKVAEMSSRLDIFDKPPKNLSVVLGAYETTLLKLVSAYNTIASGGKKMSPQFIDHISDRRGNTLYTPSTVVMEKSTDSSLPKISYIQKQVISGDVTHQLTSILEGVVQNGTGIKAKQLNMTIAGKTGTTNDSYDTWFIGYTPDIIVGVYIGFDQPKTLGQKETGAGLPLTVFIDFMKDIRPRLKNREFPNPQSEYSESDGFGINEGVKKPDNTSKSKDLGGIY